MKFLLNTMDLKNTQTFGRWRLNYSIIRCMEFMHTCIDYCDNDIDSDDIDDEEEMEDEYRPLEKRPKPLECERSQDTNLASDEGNLNVA